VNAVAFLRFEGTVATVNVDETEMMTMQATQSMSVSTYKERTECSGAPR
jgi:hypothetical protein